MVNERERVLGLKERVKDGGGNELGWWFRHRWRGSDGVWLRVVDIGISAAVVQCGCWWSYMEIVVLARRTLGVCAV